jgi:hypothetical protein
MKQTKEANKEKQQNYFWYFCVWKVETEARTTKRRKTKINTQIQLVAEICQPRTADKYRFFSKCSVAQLKKCSTNES